MSTSIDTVDSESLGFPELTALGKQIEVLRIGRGLSKQHLARYAGTSRQQLWRVMTGKTELTGALRQRLADALHVPEAAIAVPETSTASASSTTMVATGFAVPVFATAQPATLPDYLAVPGHVERTLRTLPTGDAGRELKRTLLNALEDHALKQRLTLPREFFDLRSKVLNGEI